MSMYVDRLSFTFEVPPGDRVGVRNRAADMVKSKRLRCIDTRTVPDKRRRYGNVYRLPGDEDYVEISIFPRNTEHNFGRVILNPRKLGRSGLIVVRKALVELFGLSRAREIYFDCSVTRVDLCIDVHDEISSVLMYIDQIRDSKLKRGDCGKVYSQIVGGERSTSRFTLYDKAQESVANDRQPESEFHYRLELCQRRLGCSLNDIDIRKIAEQFRRVTFFSDAFLVDPNFDKQFCDDARLGGINYAADQLRIRTGAAGTWRNYSSWLRRRYAIEIDEFLPHSRQLPDVREVLSPLRSKKYVQELEQRASAPR